MKPSVSMEKDKYQENFEDFFETALCGYIIADTNGLIIRANKKIASWLNDTPKELKGKRFSDLLGIGSKIFHETHLKPLLRIQGFFDEVVLELNSLDSQKLQVMVNAYERRDKNDQPLFIRYTILKGSDRLQYEKNLQDAKDIAEKELISQKENVALREQLIAVLGHDLRNPLSAITMAADLLEPSRDNENEPILKILKRSTSRMTELVSNIMDFARTRLGQGIVLKRQDVILGPILQQVVDEIRLIYPNREITTSFGIETPVNCDSDRLAQLLSNLLANALTHGDANFPVKVESKYSKEGLEFSVTNYGVPIPEDVNERLFTPFTREPGSENQNGLGLGLYICSEIAKAHDGTLNFVSSANEITFTFCLKS